MTSDLRNGDPELENNLSFKLVCMRITAALMRVTLGFPWVTSRRGSGGFGTDVWRVQKGWPIMEVSRQRVSSWIRAAMVSGKRCCPIPSQSRDCSG